MAGRPKKTIDYDIVSELASIQCTIDEIASVLKTTRQTLHKDDQFLYIYKEGMEQGKKSLRRMQWDAAKKGNTTMLIWLGKQYLSQKEPKQEFDIDTNSEVINQIKQLTDKI